MLRNRGVTFHKATVFTRFSLENRLVKYSVSIKPFKQPMACIIQVVKPWVLWRTEFLGSHASWNFLQDTTASSPPGSEEATQWHSRFFCKSHSLISAYFPKPLKPLFPHHHPPTPENTASLFFTLYNGTFWLRRCTSDLGHGFHS